jgi:hypothetical protein
MKNEITTIPDTTQLSGSSLEAPLSRIEQHVSIIERRIESLPMLIDRPASRALAPADLPRRDDLPFQEAPPEPPTFLELAEHMRKHGRNALGSPLAQPKPGEKVPAEKTPPENGPAERSAAPIQRRD